MQYRCPKCKNFMLAISMATVPERIYYKCLHCGYKSKSTKKQPIYTILPKELWSHDDNIE